MIQVFETENSIYEFRDAEYRRTAKADEQRVDSPKLVYGEWLPLAEIDEPFVVVPWLGGTKVLHIMHRASVAGIFTTPVVKQYEAHGTLETYQ